MRPNAEFATLLERTIGLHAASVGASVIDRAVRERLAACALDDIEAYWQRVCASKDELLALIEAVVIPETWFFRDREAIAGLARHAIGDWLPRHPEGVLRLLSLPCASGEEPYSMAMALIDAGFPMARCSIDAVDISAAALERARRALYGKNSFRGDQLDFRGRHFEPTTAGERPNEAVRRPVHLSQGNVLSTDFLAGRTYDAIFCCNLLIYFDHGTQKRVVATLARLLAADGLLFVGPAEGGALQGSDFVAAKVPRAFALRASAAVRPVERGANDSAVRQPIPAPAPVPAKARPRGSFPAVSRPLPPAAGHDSGLDAATRLADEGRLAEAATCCDRYLQSHPPSAQAHYLLGLIRAAAGDFTAAAAHYRKALYLDQNHLDTLLHFALLLEQQGDASGALRLHERRRRLEANGERR